MKRTAESGTAAALSGNGYTVAGKTGSAEYEKDGVTGTHSWFCGFAQTSEPHIVVAVIAEDGGTGSATAVPIAKQILDTFFYG
jgi:peptidoglycan glycosyltransferase